MARGSSRLRKKKQRKKLESIAKSINSGKKVKTLSYRELSSIVSDYEQKEKRKKAAAESKKIRRERLRTEKRQALNKAFNTTDFTDTLKVRDYQIDKVKLSDIQKGRNGLSIERYPFLYGDAVIDYDKVYSLGKSELLIAYRDYTGEIDILAEYKAHEKQSITELINSIDSAIHAPLTGGKGGTSGGKAGGAIFSIAPPDALIFSKHQMKKDNQRANRLLENSKKYDSNPKKYAKLKRKHYKGEDVNWQVIKSKSTRSNFKEITPRQLLVIADTILYNVTELDRQSFYKRFYADVTRVIPDMAQILPKL